MILKAVKCLETRARPDSTRRRRYLMEDGSRMTTVELPISVLKGVGMKKVKQVMATWLRGEIARTSVRARRALIEEQILQNGKPTAIAHEFGVTEERVRQIRGEIKKGKP